MSVVLWERKLWGEVHTGVLMWKEGRHLRIDRTDTENSPRTLECEVVSRNISPQQILIVILDISGFYNKWNEGPNVFYLSFKGKGNL